MFDIAVPDVAWGIWALAGAVVLAAWHEYRAANRRDARLLAALGALGLLADSVASLQ